MSNYKPIKRVSILGCGWLGFALGQKLVEKGLEVKGSNTTDEKSEQLKAAGIQPHVINLMPKDNEEKVKNFLDSDLLVVCMSPHHGEDKMETYHAQQVKFVKEMVEDLPIDKVIYISSTSVYPLSNEEINENADTDADSKASKTLVFAEEVFRINTRLDATILRCGGLMGYNRIPGKYFAGKKDLNTGEMPVNYVHRDDVINLIEFFIDKNDHNVWNKVYNVVAPKHPPRQVIYEKNAKAFGFEAPTFVHNKKPRFKVISSDKLINKAKYEFLYPDPLGFPYDPSL